MSKDMLRPTLNRLRSWRDDPQIPAQDLVAMTIDELERFFASKEPDLAPPTLTTTKRAPKCPRLLGPPPGTACGSTDTRQATNYGRPCAGRFQCLKCGGTFDA